MVRGGAGVDAMSKVERKRAASSAPPPNVSLNSDGISDDILISSNLNVVHIIEMTQEICLIGVTKPQRSSEMDTSDALGGTEGALSAAKQ